MNTLLVVILILLLLGVLPVWPYSLGIGYGPSGVLLFALIVVVVLLAVGRL